MDGKCLHTEEILKTFDLKIKVNLNQNIILNQYLTKQGFWGFGVLGF
jgi:hypothetical protein